MVSSSEVSGEVPGLLSVAMAIGTPCCAADRPAASASRAGNSRRPAAARRRCRPRQRLDAGLVGISRWSADSAPNRAASAAPPRFGSCSACSFTGRPQPRAASNTRATCSGEKAIFRRRRRPRRRGRLRRPPAASSLADQLDISVLVALGLGRHGVRAEKVVATRQRQRLAQPSRDAQRLHLAVEVEAVARLDLERRDASAHQRLDALAGRGEQLVLARRARRRMVETMPPPARAISS